MAKARKKTSARKPQRKSTTPRRKKRNPTKTAVQKFVAKAPVSRKPRFKRRNPTSGFNLTRFGLKLGGGLLGYVGANVIGKSVAGLVPVDYQAPLRITTKAGIAVLAAWQGHKYINQDLAEGMAIGAGIATVEDIGKTYLSTVVPGFFNGLGELGGWNDPGTIEISGEEEERHILEDTQYMMPSEPARVAGLVLI